MQTIIFSLIGLLALYTIVKQPSLLLVGGIMVLVGWFYDRTGVAFVAFGAAVILVMIGQWLTANPASRSKRDAHTKHMKEQEQILKHQQQRRMQEEQWEQSKKYHGSP